MLQKNLFTTALGIVAVVAAIGYVMNSPKATTLSGQPLSGATQQTAAIEPEATSWDETAASMAATAPAAGDDAAIEVSDEAGTTEPATEEPAAEVQKSEQAKRVDVKAALAARSEGNPNAPVKIEEFASLTCSHCGDFYRNTFPRIKEEYIDTGKVYFTYTDFPLNAPALSAAMAARCIPESRYFDFVKLLFDKQSEWAYNENYMTILQNDSALLGLGSEDFAACVNNEELKEGLLKRMQEAGEANKIDATPTFIINGEKLLGARPLSEFKAIIDKYVDAAAKDNKAPEEN